MIDLQSPTLVTHLKPILEVEGVFLEETEVAHLAAPFKALFFCYDKILKSHDTAEGSKSQLLHPSWAMPNSSWDIPLPEMPQNKYADFDFLGIDTVLRQHLKLLVDLMDEMFGEDKARLKNMRASGLISYDLAWTYFRRDCTVFCGLQDTTRALRVTDTEYSKPPVIRCWEIAFDGEKFSWRLMNVDIPKFDGNLPIINLTNYPLEFHPDRDRVKVRLTERGKKVLEYQELKYCEYEGLAIFKQDMLEKKHNVSQSLLDIPTKSPIPGRKTSNQEMMRKTQLPQKLGAKASNPKASSPPTQRNQPHLQDWLTFKYRSTVES
jgi:hypothetical protein